MALAKLAKINENSFWAIWEIKESLSQLLDLLYLSPSELHELVYTVHHPKKKLEWAAGRLALQTILDKFQVAQWEITKDSHGKPYLLNHEIQISLANSFPFATAIAHHTLPVGIDLEYPSEKLLRVCHKFLSQEESIMASDDLDLLCIFWCAKECVYKIHGRKMLSFKDHIFIKKVDISSKRLLVQVSTPSYQAFHELSIDQIRNFHIVYGC